MFITYPRLIGLLLEFINLEYTNTSSFQILVLVFSSKIIKITPDPRHPSITQWKVECINQLYATEPRTYNPFMEQQVNEISDEELTELESEDPDDDVENNIKEEVHGDENYEDPDNDIVGYTIESLPSSDSLIITMCTFQAASHVSPPRLNKYIYFKFSPSSHGA
ncbi:unnamed protein product [Lactuca virosa]|uniref:Uncharacterized protein n=1 Tax=Lactuca virosa TaxID=75947 RepID=A0AAU9P1Z2_9ASTR|nr:unnamed protein product [Lactuca virosa]